MLAVFLKKGLSEDFWINLVMCFLFWVPGILHALLVCDLIPANCCGAPAKAIIELVLIIVCPPAAVLMKVKFTLPFLVNLILTFLFYIPGLIHALCVYGFINSPATRKVLPV
jgi:uncharacterized membrane protein YqaE (UPF0057 family)